MGDKVSITTLTSLTNETQAIQTLNNNMQTLANAFDNTVSRDGTTPNNLTSSLDANSNRIINLAEPENLSDAARLQDVADSVEAAEQAAASAESAAGSAQSASSSASQASASALSASQSATAADVSAGSAQGFSVSAEGFASDASDSADSASADAVIATESASIASEWAIKTDGLVGDVDYSAKAYAIGGTGTETNNAKYYAEQADVAKIEWKGSWSAGTYLANDAVSYQDSSWIANTDTTEEPSEAATDWDLLASKGDIQDLFSGMSGTLKGLEVTVNSLDATAFDISAGYGIIIKSSAGVEEVTSERYIVRLEAQTTIPATRLASDYITFISIDETGTISQKGSITSSELREEIIVGALVHIENTDIESTYACGISALKGSNNALDILCKLGAVNLEGNTYTPNGTNLSLDKSAGTTYRLGTNRLTDEKDPNITQDSQTTLCNLVRTYRDGSGGFSFANTFTEIDPDNYDDGSGTLQAVPNNNFTIQRVYYYNTSDTTVVAYGQNVYSNLSKALDSVASDSFVGHPHLVNGSLRAVIVVQQGVTDLNDENAVRIIPASKFGDVSSSGGSTTITDQLVKVNSSDPSAGYLSDKLEDSSEISLTVAGDNQTLSASLIDNSVSRDRLASDAANEGKAIGYVAGGDVGVLEIPAAPVQATESTAGIAEIATDSEVTTGTDDSRIVTPLKLATRLSEVLPSSASETVQGIIELATQAEADAGTDTTRAITPATLAGVISDIGGGKVVGFNWTSSTANTATNSTSPTTVMTLSYTPVSTSSQLLLIGSSKHSGQASGYGFFAALYEGSMLDGGSAIHEAGWGGTEMGARVIYQYTPMAVLSNSSTSSRTFYVKQWVGNSSGTVYFNRPADLSSNPAYSKSFLAVIEIEN